MLVIEAHRTNYAQALLLFSFLFYFILFLFSEMNPIPTEDIVNHFNELRQDIVLLYELKLALANCEYELQTLRHRFDTLAPGKVNLTLSDLCLHWWIDCTVCKLFMLWCFMLQMPDLGGVTTVATPETPSMPLLQAAGDIKVESPTKVSKKISETIDVVGTTPITPNVSIYR